MYYCSHLQLVFLCLHHQSLPTPRHVGSQAQPLFPPNGHGSVFSRQRAAVRSRVAEARALNPQSGYHGDGST